MNKYAWLFASLLCGFSPAQGQSIDAVNATFTVEYNNKNTQGESHLTISQQQQQYRIRFGLDHWLLSVQQDATFEMDQCQVRPLRYKNTTKRPLKSETTQTIDYDWQQLLATYNNSDDSDKNKTFSLNGDAPTHTLYDPISFFFEARCELIAGATQFSYPVIYKGKQRTHRYQVVGTETVETAQGDVEALVVERDRRSKTRQTRLYVAPSLDYLLVKIEHQESRLLSIVATLKHMDYTLLDHDDH